MVVPRTIHPFPRCPKVGCQNWHSDVSAYSAAGGEHEQQQIVVLTSSFFSPDSKWLTNFIVPNNCKVPCIFSSLPFRLTENTQYCFSVQYSHTFQITAPLFFELFPRDLAENSANIVRKIKRKQLVGGSPKRNKTKPNFPNWPLAHNVWVWMFVHCFF